VTRGANSARNSRGRAKNAFFFEVLLLLLLLLLSFEAATTHAAMAAADAGRARATKTTAATPL